MRTERIISGRILRWPPFVRYCLAIAAAFGAILLRLALEPIWGVKLPFITLFPAIMLSAWLGGLGPGLLTTAITAIAAQYYWIAPRGSFAVADKSELLGQFVFIAIGVVISALNEGWRRGASIVALSEQRLAVTLSSIGDGVITTDDRGSITGLNPAAEQLTGWSAEQAIGRHVDEVLMLVNEETRQPTANPVERVIREGVVSGLANHTVLITRDKREVPIDDSAAPVRADDGRLLGAVMVFRDITERRQMERERTARARIAQELAAIVQSSDDAIVGMDLNGVITAWNAAAERMYGYAAREVIGQSIRLIVPEERAGEEDRILERIHRGERLDHYETVRRRQDGGDVAVSLTVSPIRDAAGALIGVSKVARDISARKRLDDERAALLARDQEARVEMERASRLKDEFLAVLSHELRTPLSAVIGYANLLASGALPKERTGHALDAIRRNAQAQAQLVDSLLDLSRVLAGKFELTVEPVDAWRIVEASIDVVRPQAHAKHVAIDVNPPQRTLTVTGDASRLQQVFWNLLSNAVKFTPAGGLVSINALEQDGHVSIVITDTGSGISDGFLPHVFDRFSQGEIQKRSSTAGLGLGLALVREIVHAHGGAITAASAGEGLGSTFTVTVPAAAGALTSASAATVAAHPTESHSLHEVDVLVVDDEADVRHLLTLLLEAHGASVRSASSSSEALGAIRERRPHVLLADLRMPNEDGYSLIRTIRTGERGHEDRLAAIAVTAYARATDRDQALEAGYDAHVPKPVEADELLRTIVNVVSRT